METGSEMLEDSYESMEQVPEELASFYQESEEGQAVLNPILGSQISGLKSALTKERKIRTDAQKAADQLKKKMQNFDGIDPEEYSEMRNKLDELEQKAAGGDNKDKVDELINTRLKRQEEQYQKVLKQRESEVEELKAIAERSKMELKNYKIEQDVIRAAVECQAHETALDDIKARAKANFELDENGQIIVVDHDGQPILNEKTGLPETPKGWVQALQKNAPHLFKQSSGGGTGPNASAGRNLGSNKPASQMTSQEKVDWIGEHGQKAWGEKLKNETQKAK